MEKSMECLLIINENIGCRWSEKEGMAAIVENNKSIGRLVHDDASYFIRRIYRLSVDSPYKGPVMQIYYVLFCISLKELEVIIHVIIE